MLAGASFATSLAAQERYAALQTAQAPSPELRQQYDAAFAAMLGDPGNLDKIFRFAELAVAVGDLEGAVSALERMLLIDANLPRVRLELGVLYYRLGSFEAARTYLLAALAAPNLPADVRARAETFLAEIERQRAPSKLNGTLMTGIRYQSNANAAPTGTVRVGGIPATLDDNSTAASDWNVFVALNALHELDMGTQYGDAWETRAVGYATRQFERQEVDVALGSISTGPRFALLPKAVEGLSLRPAIALDYVMLDDSTDYTGYGVSLSLDKKIGRDVIGLGVDWRHRNYNSTSDNVVNDDRTGRELSARIGWDFVFAQWLTGAVSAGYADYNARKAWESYGEIQLGLSFNVYLDFSPFVKEQKTALVIAGSHLRANYNKADPVVDPDEKRRDRDWRLSLTGSLPLTESISLVAQGGYARRNSSLPNYEYTNWFGMTALAWRF
ncbi:MAG: tetratricopeptide repeat protein [Reyranellaceae bacterium]